MYIYDKRGLEVHCLREHLEVHAMDFLPNHFLLATIGKPGVLIYTVRAETRVSDAPLHCVPPDPPSSLLTLLCEDTCALRGLLGSLQRARWFVKTLVVELSGASAECSCMASSRAVTGTPFSTASLPGMRVYIKVSCEAHERWTMDENVAG